MVASHFYRFKYVYILRSADLFLFLQLIGNQAISILGNHPGRQRQLLDPSKIIVVERTVERRCQRRS